MNKLNQKGVVDLIFVAVLLVLVAAIAFTLWKVNQTDETVSNTEVNTSNSSTVSSKIGSNTDGDDLGLAEMISFTNPDGWSALDCAEYISDGDQLLLSPDIQPASGCDDREDVILIDLSVNPANFECTESQNDPDSKGNREFSCDESQRDGLSIVNSRFIRANETWANTYLIIDSNQTFMAGITTYYPATALDSEYISILEELVSTVELN